MSPRIKKTLTSTLITTCLFLLILVWLWFGKSGFGHLFRSEAERQACIERIHKLAKENQALLDEVELLRTDMRYVESVARRELNVIKKNELIYRFKKESDNQP